MRYWLAILATTLAACGGDGSSSPPARPVVSDTTPPVITLTGDNPQFIEAGKTYTELGATATDSIDGDLSASIVIDSSAVDTTVPGDYMVTYDVSDSSGNAATTVTRTVTVQDTTPPVIRLLGDDPQVIITGDVYTELGATASDSLDGDLTAAIVIDASAVDTTKAGDYAVSYNVSDATGNAAATVTRTVRIQNPPLPAAPTVSIEGDIKQLIFSWDAVAGAKYYRLLENADGHSGFTQVGEDIPPGTLMATRDIAVHLLDWVEAQYLVEACNIGGCNSSSVITVTDVMLDTVGYFKAPDSKAWNQFGSAVAMSADGNTLAVGSSVAVGTVHLFRFDGKEWYQQAYFEDPDAKDDVWFGVSVSLSADGNMLAVGSAGRTAAVESIGSIYLFQFDGSNWHQQALIQPSDVEIVRGFGHAVDLSADGKTLVVGAEWEYSGSTGINSIPTDDLAGSSGAAYVFRRNGDDWHQEAYIKPSNTEYLDLFGVSVSLSADGNSMAVGASGEDSIAIGIDGDQSDNSVESAGAVYLFRFDGADWYQQAYVKASNTGPDWGLGLYAYFGHSVSLSANGNALVVGAPGESSAATGVNGDQDDNRAQSAGAAYLFQFDGIDWHQEAYVKASNTGTWHRFGASVTLSGDARILAVGSSGENGAAVGINGDQMDGWAYHAGAVYIFRLDDTGWNQQAYVKASNTGGGEPMPPEQCDKHETCRWPGDAFGSSIALSETGRTMAVGAPGEDSAANGIDGDQEDNSAESAGAVYVY